MSWEKVFLKDLATLRLGELRDKYQEKIPEQITISSLIKIAKEQNLISSLISNNWYGDYRDKNPILLMQKKSGEYEVFDSERGGRLGITKHADIESALRDYLSRVLNDEMLFSPTDIWGYDE